MDELTIAFKIESPPSWLPIGRTAENNWRAVEIDCSYWFNMSADGSVVLMYKPSCGMSPYPLLTEREGDNIIWRPKSGELVEGVGRLQAFFEVGTDVIGSSEMISCEVDSSLLGVDPGTDPGQTDLPWALDIIEQIAELSGHYPKIVNGVLCVWDSEIEEWVQFEGGSSDAVLYTEQELTDAQKAQARTNIGAASMSDIPSLAAYRTASAQDAIDAAQDSAIAAKYTKPSGGIPDSDIASAAVWNTKGTYSKPSGGIPKSDLAAAVKTSLGKADTALQQHQSLAGYATESYVQQQIANIPDELPAVTAFDNGKFLRVADGAWTAEVGDEHDAYSALPSDTASGAIASFPDGADDAPVKSLVAQIAPVQSGSGDPSPTNIRPISGWTSATVTRTGADNQSDTYTIAFPSEAGTVYGGTLDVTNGVLTVDSTIVDMGTLNWMYYSNQQRMVAQVNSAKPAMANVGLDGACSVYKVINTGYQSAPDKSIVIGNNFISQSYAAMVVYDSDYTDAETFKTAVSGQTLVFPIKNPITYQLDPVTVTTLLGTNSIWADTGDVAVNYRADTGLYIQKLTGSTEEDMIADAPIASGKYFLVGNTLYLSTAAIAAGATLTPGTNCVKTNLAEALNALNS